MNMRIIEHCYKRHFYRTRIITHHWTFTIEHNGVGYNGEIEYNCYASNLIDENADFDGYFVGYLWNPEIRARYNHSDVRNKVKYILEDMKKVIEGDFSNVIGAGIYKRDISNLK